MAVVKIFSETNENLTDICESLSKALSNKNDSDIENKRFDDPLMNLLLEDIDKVYREIYKNMLQEIIEVLVE